MPDARKRHLMSLSACAGLIAFVLVLTLTGRAIDTIFARQVEGLVHWVRQIPALSEFEVAHLEKISNVALFVPLGIAFALALGKRWWAVGVALGATLSVASELMQFFFLPNRTASLTDVLLNTIGTAIGAGSVALFWAANRRRRRNQ